MGLVKTLLYRAYTICSNYYLFDIEIRNLKRILPTNGFPVTIVNNIIRKFLDKQRSSKIIHSTVPRKQINIIIPFFGTFSINIKKQLQRILRRAYPQIDFRFVFRSVLRLGKHFRVKDILPIELSSNVIYRYN